MSLFCHIIKQKFKFETYMFGHTIEIGNEIKIKIKMGAKKKCELALIFPNENQTINGRSIHILPQCFETKLSEFYFFITQERSFFASRPFSNVRQSERISVVSLTGLIR